MTRFVFGEVAPPFAWHNTYQQKHKALLAKGSHPMTLQPLRTDGTKCKQCAHFLRVHYSKSYLKCELAPQTGGPATDCRANWPACELFVHVDEDHQQQDIYPPR